MVSIHARAKRATRADVIADVVVFVSIHARAKRATTPGIRRMDSGYLFQSTHARSVRQRVIRAK